MPNLPSTGTPGKIDARGLMCPEPIRLAELAMRDLAPGAIMCVHTTDPAAPIDFEAWCLRKSHEYLACEAQSEGWIIRVRKQPLQKDSAS